MTSMYAVLVVLALAISTAESYVDECSSGSRCVNGRCSNLSGSFFCKCLLGFTGELCDQDVDECSLSKPCANGRCINTPGSFSCKCSPGFTGKLCNQACTQAYSVDLGLVLDGSGSAGIDNFITTKLFLLNLVDRFRVGPAGSHFGVIVYSDTPQLCLRFTEQEYQNPIGLKLKILSVDFPDGETRTDKALTLAARTLFTPYGPGDRPDFPNVLVVITNGNSAHGSESYEKVLKPLKDRGVKIIAVGVGSGVSDNELLEIAMGKRQNVVHADSAENLDLHLAKIIRNIC